MLREAGPTRRRTTARRAPLAGKLYLPDGSRLTPTHSRGASGRIYRYYAPLAGQTGQPESGPRLSTMKFEAHVRTLLQPVIGRAGRSVRRPSALDGARRSPRYLPAGLVLADVGGTWWNGSMSNRATTASAGRLPFAVGSGAVTIAAARQPARRDPVLIRALRTAHAMLEHDRTRPAGPAPRAQATLRSASCPARLPVARAPGGDRRRAPAATLTLEKIVRGDLPLDWK